MRVLYRMRSLCLTSIACIIVLSATSAFAQDATSPALSQDDVDRAVRTLEEDPNFAPTRKIRSLRWSGDQKVDIPKRGSWRKWLADLFGWIAQVSRVFVWLLIALLVAIIALYLWRFTTKFGGPRAARASETPTHVRDLDIRPESLPDDIGAAAWALWQQGEHRNALSLLYRGVLSRLVHIHGVQIKDSSTEGDCLALAQRHLPADRIAYVREMIKTWQHAIYGGAQPTNERMQQLCSQFGAALDSTAATSEAQP
jgi:hypothetical protein